MELFLALVATYFSSYLFFLWLGCLTSFVAAKVLVWDSKLSIREVIFLVFAAFLCTQGKILPYFFYYLGVPLNQTIVHIFSYGYKIIPVILLFIYFYKLKSYPIKKAIILAIFSYLITFATLFTTRFIFQTFFGLPQIFDIYQPVLSIITRLFANILTVFFALFVVKVTTNLRNKINENPSLQTVLMAGSLTGWITYEVMYSIITFVEDGTISLWMSAVLLGYVLATVLSFFFYTRSLNVKLALQQKESEQRDLLFYTNEIEQQQASVRKFKHDYQNILLSLEGFFEADDLPGAKECYYSQIKTISEVVTKNEFTLDRLSKIMLPEIKGFLAAKLMTAQSDGVDTSIEVDGEIDYIPIDSVTVVRMLGIILDNAIEELRELGSGKLEFACYKVDDGVTFVVENTCRSDIQTLHELEQIGFSTKGKKRGLGLNNLSELVAANASVIALQTNITNGRFIQKLRIGGM